ncbi:MAG: hypothetical protein DRJ40_01645 [Thermoprotei archaeon]|nr:MAG: hypothetical protein DRJ40_01645 [Thermoprotei archaeon]
MNDSCRHIVSARGWGPDFSAKDFVELAVKHGVVSSELAREIIMAIRLGSIIVYRYLGINYEELYRGVQKLTTLARDFEREVVSFLRKVLGISRVSYLGVLLYSL